MRAAACLGAVLMRAQLEVLSAQHQSRCACPPDVVVVAGWHCTCVLGRRPGQPAVPACSHFSSSRRRQAAVGCCADALGSCSTDVCSCVSCACRRVLQASEPGTIRGDYCIEVGRNVIHGSDSVENAQKEIALWFGGEYVGSSAWRTQQQQNQQPLWLFPEHAQPRMLLSRMLRGNRRCSPPAELVTTARARACLRGSCCS